MISNEDFFTVIKICY